MRKYFTVSLTRKLALAGFLVSGFSWAVAEMSVHVIQDLKFGTVTVLRVVPTGSVSVAPNGTVTTNSPFAMSESQPAIVRVEDKDSQDDPVAGQHIVATFNPLQVQIASNPNVIVGQYVTDQASNTCITNQLGQCDFKIGATISVEDGRNGSFHAPISILFEESES